MRKTYTLYYISYWQHISVTESCLMYVRRVGLHVHVHAPVHAVCCGLLSGCLPPIKLQILHALLSKIYVHDVVECFTPVWCTMGILQHSMKHYRVELLNYYILCFTDMCIPIRCKLKKCFIVRLRYQGIDEQKQLLIQGYHKLFHI